MGAPLWLTASVITAINAMVFGMDTGTIGPVTTMESFSQTMGSFSSVVHGVIVSTILLPGAFAALFAGLLADRYGRTQTIALGSTVFGVGAAIEAGSVHLAMFIVGRVVKGLGEGLFLSAVFVYVAEISPARVRGVITTIPQCMITLGLVTGYFTSYGTSMLPGSISWRLPIALQALLALANAALSGLVPPSPRWLAAAGRADEARAVVERLGLADDEKAELLALSAEGVEHPPDQSLWAGVRRTAADLRAAFAPEFRARTVFGCFLMAMQQFSGIDGVLYYAPSLLQQAGVSGDQASFLASGVSALLIMAATVPATLLADHWGRRTSTLVGGAGITGLMLIMGSLYAAGVVHGDHGAGRWVVIVCIYLFALVYSVTWAVGVRAYLIESQPRKTRSSASSLGQGSNWIANYIVALTTPVFLASSSFGAYFFFAACTLFTTAVCALAMDETKGHSLEAIEKRYNDRQASGTDSPWKIGKGGVGMFRLRRLRGTQGQCD